MAVGSAQAANAAYEDGDVDYASLQFSQSKGREGPVYANIHQGKAVTRHDDVEYSSVRFTQPMAATRWVFLGITPKLKKLHKHMCSVPQFWNKLHWKKNNFPFICNVTLF